MNNEKLVSIIMPVYNAEKYLRDAIDSMVIQSYPNIELIIINDGSTDSSELIIEEYAEKYPQIVVVSRENKGLIKTLNEGIAIAKGEYIARMDADDISKYNRIEKQVAFMENNPEVMIAGCYFDILVENGTDCELLNSMYKLQRTINSFTNATEQNMFMGYVILHATWIIRKELLDKIGGYKEYGHCEDGEFLFRILSNGYKIGVVEESMYQYRIYNTSKSGNDRLNNNGLKEDDLKYRLNYMSEKFGEDFSKDYFIWGYSYSGIRAREEVEKTFKKARFIGYIDSFANKQDTQDMIIRPDEIKNNSNCYVVVATHGGLKYALDFMQQIGYKAVEDYFCVV